MRLIHWVQFWVHALVVCCGLIEAGPREAVAVAIAVDDLLQTNTPALPDHLGGNDQRDLSPGPAPSPAPGVCACGCGKTGCRCGRSAAFADSGGVCSGEPAAADWVVVPDEPLVFLDMAAVEAAGVKQKRRVIVGVADRAAGDGPCPYCDQTVAALGAGDADTEVIVVPRTKLHFVPRALPVIYFPDAAIVHYGRIDLPRLKATLSANPPTVPQSYGFGVDVGTLKGADAAAKLFDLVTAQPSGSAVVIGPARLTVPAALQLAVALSPDGLKITFPGRDKPRVQVGTGWLSVGRPLSSLGVSRDRVTLGIDGFADMSLRLE
jgi:hypothetical protein